MIHLIGDGNGIIGMPLATAVFLLIYKLEIKSSWICAALASISVVSLDMYLSSYIFDLTYYKWIKDRFYENQSQFGIWILVIVPLVFVSSYIFSICKKYLFQAPPPPHKIISILKYFNTSILQYCPPSPLGGQGAILWYCNTSILSPSPLRGLGGFLSLRLSFLCFLKSLNLVSFL